MPSREVAVPDSLDSIAMRIRELDVEIAQLRADLRDRKETRDALVDTMADIVGLQGEVSVSTPLGTVTAKPRRQVLFPTKATNPAAQASMIAVLKTNRLWDRFSVLSYASLKSAWLQNDTHLQTCRTALSPLANERVELDVRSRNPGIPGRAADAKAGTESTRVNTTKHPAPVRDAPNPF